MRLEWSCYLCSSLNVRINSFCPSWPISPHLIEKRIWKTPSLNKFHRKILVERHYYVSESKTLQKKNINCTEQQRLYKENMLYVNYRRIFRVFSLLNSEVSKQQNNHSKLAPCSDNNVTEKISRQIENNYLVTEVCLLLFKDKLQEQDTSKISEGTIRTMTLISLYFFLTTGHLEESPRAAPIS